MYKRITLGSVYVSESVLADFPADIDSDTLRSDIERGINSYLMNMSLTQNALQIKSILNLYCGENNWKIVIDCGTYLQRRVGLQKELWFCTNFSENHKCLKLYDDELIIRQQNSKTKKNILIHKNPQILYKWEQRGGIPIYYNDHDNFVKTMDNIFKNE